MSPLPTTATSWLPVESDATDHQYKCESAGPGVRSTQTQAFPLLAEPLDDALVEPDDDDRLLVEPDDDDAPLAELPCEAELLVDPELALDAPVEPDVAVAELLPEPLVLLPGPEQLVRIPTATVNATVPTISLPIGRPSFSPRAEHRSGAAASDRAMCGRSSAGRCPTRWGRGAVLHRPRPQQKALSPAKGRGQGDRLLEQLYCGAAAGAGGCAGGIGCGIMPGGCGPPIGPPIA